MNNQTSLESVIAEYSALREETLFRLGVQQQVINYSLLLVGFVVTLLSIKDLDWGAVLVMLLLVPLVGILLTFIYLKQHMFVMTLDAYISTLSYTIRVSPEANKDNALPFAGWRSYLNKMIYGQKLPSRFMRLFGPAEGGFPLFISLTVVLICWLILNGLRSNALSSALLVGLAKGGNIDPLVIASVWLMIDGGLWASALIVKSLVWQWVSKQR